MASLDWMAGKLEKRGKETIWPAKKMVKKEVEEYSVWFSAAFGPKWPWPALRVTVTACEYTRCVYKMFVPWVLRSKLCVTAVMPTST